MSSPSPQSHPGSLRIVVVGQGYVGLPLAVSLGEAGHHVVGYDIHTERVRLLAEARVPEAPEGLRRVLASGRYRPSDDPAVFHDAEAIIVCVPTPLSPEGRPDPGIVLEAARVLRERAPAAALIVLESTVAPGFVDGPLREALGEALHRIAYAPERIDPGPARPPLRSIPRLVAGVTPEASASAAALYRSLGAPVHEVSMAVASWAKLLENTYRLVNIALVGEFATACSTSGVDIDAVIAAAATKPFGFASFHPGPGAGGHCIPVNPLYLLEHLGTKDLDLPLVRAALSANAERPRAVARAIAARLPRARSGRVLLIGVAYKADVSDTRLTAARPIRDLLVALGHEVWFHDPLVPELDGQRGVPLTEETLRAADVIALLVAHQGVEKSRLASAGRPVVDACGAMAGTHSLHVNRV
ncbi:nucleotide sugar dehydrogenase [Hyalangium gracile]|uniref:nucleotide sugar dehydrogenase n=1 Tax=Hyalangium gracile TaxID=394092 RepID=UPI001CCB02D4|nr:nucleotide sugar dehydrogenase [Hyalangium gracile]